MLNKNKFTGYSNDFGIVECYSPEDAEYLLRVVSASDFRLNGSPVSGTLSKLNRQSFYELYGRLEVTESQQEQNYQRQKYMEAYYKQFFDHLAKSGYYYDAQTNQYRRIEDQNSFEKVILEPAPPAKGIPESSSLIQIAMSEDQCAQIAQKSHPNVTDENNKIENVQPPEPNVPELKQTAGFTSDKKEDESAMIQVTLANSDDELPCPEKRVYCLICFRQFISDAHLTFHKKYSNMHKSNILAGMTTI